jgi:DNA polymerase-1
MPKKKAAADRRRLVLLDSHAIIHRAYHALPDFTSPSGEPTGALYGLSSMLLRIISDLKPDYIAACYDLPKPTVRHEAYADYKGTRTKTDDLLAAQLKSSRNVFEAFGIPMYDREGFEADDILGTIAHQFKDDPELEIVIASGDMDTLQLVDGDRVQVYTLKKGINDTILYDEKAVRARFGFPPALIPDYKGLCGDPSDNIKGVPGIGDKTATELITGFGSVEDIYKKLKKGDAAFTEKGIKPRVITLLTKHEEDAKFSKMLATIRTDAPIAFKLPSRLFIEGAKLAPVLAMFDAFGFRSLKARATAVFGGEDTGEEMFLEEGNASAINVPQEKLEEAKVMTWLLHSEFTSPSADDILAFAKADDFDEAYTNLEKKIAETGRLQKVYEDIEKPLIPVIAKMEARGVMIDAKELARLSKKYAEELDEIAKRIYQAAGKEFNIASPKQLGDILFDTLGLTVPGQKKTSGGQRSTRESELEKIRGLHPVVADILEYRQLQKLLGTYLEAIPPLLDAHSRLHAKFLQTGTTTGRMSSSDPNLQNIPIRTERGRAIRHAFIAPEGFTLVALDYSQIELRLAAILSRDPVLSEIFKSGRDVHREVAARVFNVPPDQVDAEMRRRAKVINFGILYGMGVNALKAQLGTSIGEAHAFLDDYFRTFKRLSEYLEETKGYARKYGFTETLFGRRRQFPEMKSPLPYVRAQAERTAINAPIQGTQADIIKLAMVRIDAMLTATKASDDAHLLLQIHDELVYEIRTERFAELSQKIKQIMEDVLPPSEANNVPIATEARRGKNWGEMEKL